MKPEPMKGLSVPRLW